MTKDKKMQKTTRVFNISVVNRIAIFLLIATSLSVVGNVFYRVQYSAAVNARHDLIYYANKFMAASDYLTDEARAFAATGIVVHYENYWNEVNVRKNREFVVGKLKEIGITKQEEALIDSMSQISDALIPLEKEAMELAADGDNIGAINIVYGVDYYNGIMQINKFKEEFIEGLEKRTEEKLDGIFFMYRVSTALTWILVGATILLQRYQKNALFQLAYVDELTGGDNYSAFREKMQNGSGIGGDGYVVSADLRSFGTINDTCGVAKGDEVIREMSKIFEKNLQHGELAAHVIGDRFALFLHSESDEELINRLSGIRSEIAGLSAVLDVPFIAPTFGIRAVDTSTHPEISYGDANLAKEYLREQPDNHYYAIYDKKMQEQLLERHAMEDCFEPALQERQFEMWYQPKYAPGTKRLVGAEALVRWRKPDNSIVPPGKFIPVYEKNGMIAQLDEYTFETVCAQQREWMDSGTELVPISINVSRASLFYTDIVGRYLAIANRYRIPISCIELEITESAMDSNDSIEEIIRQFRLCGFRILVDDFGSGYSSLSTLTKDYFDCIKIDKSLVDCIGTPEGNSLLESTIHLAHEFGMSVTAEGVEQAEQVEALLKLSCDNIQGYYFSRPLPVPEFCKLFGAG